MTIITVGQEGPQWQITDRHCLDRNWRLTVHIEGEAFLTVLRPIKTHDDWVKACATARPIMEQLGLLRKNYLPKEELFGN